MLPAPDAKWLDFLKAGLPSFLGLATFAGATLYLDRLGYLPMPLPPVVALVIAIAGLLSGCLAGGLVLEAVYRVTVWVVRPLYVERLQRKQVEKQKREFNAYIPHLSERDRMIFAHLLHHNQRAFENTADCGYASTLYSLGFVRLSGVPGSGRTVDPYDVPFSIPDPVWDALVERRDEFPYRLPNAPRSRTAALSPWRKPGAP